MCPKIEIFWFRGTAFSQMPQIPWSTGVTCVGGISVIQGQIFFLWNIVIWFLFKNEIHVLWYLRVSSQILSQLRVTSTQFQEKYPYIARNVKGYLTLNLNNLVSVLKFWASQGPSVLNFRQKVPKYPYSASTGIGPLTLWFHNACRQIQLVNFTAD